ncbi:sulfotransferase family 2 domain-containing protein [Roseomonas eburnea]|uniref:Sulfotransferase family 2 domain-containing protein n=1 Tax=Neoroseomonas eburnea TaxID=1346889 RepID=A0A9X9X821_9PROT|nr:sulfotransferase family 2 domain-containing protein [Neoroseomonas eburnea]MBR0679857.1 sulfotransferase family 2 domain-containing protein [Neoroseomonas eburnea]
MIWSPSRKFCFIHISKTGGTSVEEAYAPHLRFGDIILSAHQHGMNHWYGKHLAIGKHTPARRIRLMAGRQNFDRVLSVAVVRDPIDRMVSYYRWIHTGTHGGQRERELSEIKEFEPFAEKVCTFFLRQVDMVTDPQTGAVIVSHLIPFRRLAEGWAGVAARIGLDAALPHVNASSRKVGVQVPDSARAMLRETFARDAALVEAAERDFVPLSAGQPAQPATASQPGAGQAA